MWAAFWFPAPLRGWYLFITGLYTSFGLFLDCPHFLPYYSVVFAVMTQSCWAFLGLPFTLSPNALTWPLVFLLMVSYVPFVFSLGHPWPVCFLWAFSSILLILHSHGLSLTSLDFPNPITSFSSLGFMGLSLTPYFLCCITFGPSVAHSHFFYIIYCSWVCYFSLFGLFKAHLPPQGPFIYYWALYFLWPISWLPSFSAILLCRFCCNDSILLGLFRPAVYSFPQCLNMTIGFLTYGFLCPFCFFFWASLAHLLPLGFLILFTNSAFLWAITNFIGIP